jgi:MFS family permease
VLTASTTAQTAVSFVNFGLPSIGPELRAEYGLTLAQLGAVLTAGLFGAGLVLIASGIAVDVVGARLTMLVGTALGTAGLASAAVAPSWEALMASLVLFGVGSAVVPIAGTGALFRVYPAARRGWALGVRQMAVPLGGIVAALSMPLLVRAGGVELAFGVAAGALLLAGIAFSVLLHEPGHRGHRPLPRGFRSIVRAPGMHLLLAVATFYIVVLQAVVSYMVPAVRAAGMSALVAAVAYFAVNVAAMVARITWGKVADLKGGSRRRRTLVETGLVASVGAVVFTFALHAGPVLAICAAILFGFGALGWNALVYVSAGELATLELAARAVSVAATVIFLASAVCTPILGAVAARAGWDAFWASTAVLALIGAYLASRLPDVVR